MIVSDFTIGFVVGSLLMWVVFYFYGLRILHELSARQYELGVKHGKEQSAWAAFLKAMD